MKKTMGWKLGFVLILLFSFIVPLTQADVGVGISPSKFVLQMEGGRPQTHEFVVFNPGDAPLEIAISIDGEIAEFTTVEPSHAIIEPEPQPHERPIKNSRNFVVTFNPPASRTAKTYKGSIAATGGPSGGQFGGNVGVATLVELTALPPKSIFDYLTTTHWIIIGFIILLIILIILLKRAGLKVRFEK